MTSPLRMRAPITYVLDWSPRYLEDINNAAVYADAPPDVMHMGKTVPILHLWGPVPLMHGENQRTGGPNNTLNWDAIRLLTPDELRQRIEFIRAFTQKWHDVGVKTLVCYSSFHTIAGDHEQRRGFWNFFDHWDDYLPWLYPKPAADPFDWLMVGRSGVFVPGDCGGFSPPYYAPLHRYRCCPEHPEWRRFQAQLTRLIAQVGYDGVFVDNTGPQDLCFCRYCRDEFRKFVQALPARELTILGYKGDPAAADLLAKENPAELVRRYRIDTCRRYLRMVREAGCEVRPNFAAFPNYSDFESFMAVSDSCEYSMFESTYMPGCALSAPPPDAPFVTVEVEAIADAETKNHVAQPPSAVHPGFATDAGTQEFFLSVNEPDAGARMHATLRLPRQVRAGEPATLTARIDQVGRLWGGAEWADEFAFVFIHEPSGREERVALPAALVVGNAKGLEGVAAPVPAALASGDKKLISSGDKYHVPQQSPPVELSAPWTPREAGRYRVRFAHRHASGREAAARRRKEFVSDLPWDAQYQTHIGHLQYSMHAGARTLSLDYQCTREGLEAVQELCQAEMAAFSNGSSVGTRGVPQKKYARFFARTWQLYEGFEPLADIGLLYGFWGDNPDTLLIGVARQEVHPATDLAARQRLTKVVMDTTLDDAGLRGLRTLILCGHKLELTDAQLDALRRFRRRGGEVYAYRKDTAINAKPLGKFLKRVPLWTPRLDVAGCPPVIAGDALARGLRVSAFVKPAEWRMTLHVVNYSVTFREKPARATPVAGATATVTLPKGWSVASVRAWDTDSESVADVPFTQEDERLTIPLPAVRIYAVVEIVAE